MELSYFLQLPSLLVSNAANLLGDNLASVFTANNPVTSTRSRHLDVRFFKIRDLIDLQHLKFVHLRGIQNIADFFTNHCHALSHCLS